MNSVKRSPLKSVALGVLSLAGLRILDPLEVFYLPEENTFYPIISKSGCSSIKVMLIRKFLPEFEAGFPEIHKINPNGMTQGKVQRLFFKTWKGYTDFARNKKAVVVIRDPYSRIYSCFLDVKSGKNIMYYEPVNLDWVMKFKRSIDFDTFLEKVYSIPDRLSDRHFRSQAFSFSPEIEKSVQSCVLKSLPAFMSEIAQKEGREIKINTNESRISDEIREKLMKDLRFELRFKADLALYAKCLKSISQ